MPGGETDDSGLPAHCRSMRVVRDVAYFLHQQAEYSGHIDDDLDYTFFGEDYWQALVDEEDMVPDVQRGCLALLYAMGMHEAGNVGVALGDKLQRCVQVLRRFDPPNEDTQRLRDVALQALRCAATPQDRRDWDKVKSLMAEGEWVHQVAVRRYFQARAR